MQVLHNPDLTQMTWLLLSSPCVGCECLHGYRYKRVGGKDPTCTIIPPVKWHIWGPLLAVAAILLAIALRYLWLRLLRYLAHIKVNSKQHPPGGPLAPLSKIYNCVPEAKCMY